MVIGSYMNSEINKTTDVEIVDMKTGSSKCIKPVNCPLGVGSVALFIVDNVLVCQSLATDDEVGDDPICYIYDPKLGDFTFQFSTYVSSNYKLQLTLQCSRPVGKQHLYS